MSSRLKNLRVVDPVLTKLIYGYTNAQFVGTFLLPVIEVENEAAQVPVWNKDHFKIYNTRRAIRTKTNVISPSGASTVAIALQEDDAAIPIDYREDAESLFDLQSIYSYQASDILELSLEKTIADLAQTAGTFPSGNKIKLSDQGEKQWTESDSSPVTNVQNAREAIRSKIGQFPNVAILGATAYKTLKTHEEILDLIKYSQPGIVTLDFLKSIFEIPNIYVGMAIYANDAGTFYDIWSDNMIIGYVRNSTNAGQVNARVGNSMMEPAFGYTFRKRGYPQIDAYQSEDKKVEYVRKTDFTQAKVVGSEAGYLIEDVNGA